jgi:hypothetical protein
MLFEVCKLTDPSAGEIGLSTPQQEVSDVSAGGVVCVCTGDGRGIIRGLAVRAVRLQLSRAFGDTIVSSTGEGEHPCELRL